MCHIQLVVSFNSWQQGPLTPSYLGEGSSVEQKLEVHKFVNPSSQTYTSL